MSNYKLIYIFNHYSNDSQQHYAHIQHLLECLAQKGIEIAVLIEKCEGPAPISNIESLTYYNPHKSGIFNRSRFLFITIRDLHKKGYKHVFIRITTYAAIVSIICSWIFQLKTFFWISSQGSIEYYNNLPIGLKKVKQYFLQILPFSFVTHNITYVVTGPESMINYYSNSGLVPKTKLKLLYNDINLERFKPSSNVIFERNKFGIPSDKLVVLFVHRFSPVRKTHLYIPSIIESCKQELETNQVLFVFAGSGPEEAQIRKSISEYIDKKHVLFLGGIPNSTIHSLYQAADIFINPTYAEGFPRVLLEAMACGLPFVSTNAGGIQDIVQETAQSEFVVDKNNVQEFSQNLIHLIHHPEKRQLLSQGNLNHVKRYGTEQVANMYIQTIFHS